MATELQCIFHNGSLGGRTLRMKATPPIYEYENQNGETEYYLRKNEGNAYHYWYIEDELKKKLDL